MKPLARLICAATLILACAPSSVRAQRFEGVGILTGADVGHIPIFDFPAQPAISDDGSVVVGTTRNSNGGIVAYERITRISSLQMPSGETQYEPASLAYAASADGKTIIGWALPVKANQDAEGSREAIVWKNGVPMRLGDFGGGVYLSEAHDVSDDGATIVGYGTNDNGQTPALWRDGSISAIDPSIKGIAHAVSADGAVVAGYVIVEAARYAFRWSAQNGFTNLGVLPGDTRSEAFGISADGKVVVGVSASGFGESDTQAFRWENGRILPLGMLPGRTNSAAYDVSSDGSTIVGTSGGSAFIWTKDDGMREMKEVLEDLGIDVEGWSLQAATGISADGTIIVGFGTNPQGRLEAWKARVDGGVQIIVNSTANRPDENPDDQFCDTGEIVTRGGSPGSPEPECTLHAALQTAAWSGWEGRPSIVFEIPESDPVINLEDGLSIDTPVRIVGTTQDEFVFSDDKIGHPAVEIASPSSPTLTITADGVEIRGLIVRNGIRIRGNDARISSNYIGTDRDGIAPRGSGDGIVIDDMSGALIEYNLISGNQENGIRVTNGRSSDIRILHNSIGLARSGDAALSNRRGIVFDNVFDVGESRIEANYVSANVEEGIALVRTDGLIIANNWIGFVVGASGQREGVIPNGRDAIKVNVSNGTVVERNLISAPTSAFGISISQDRLDDRSTGTIVKGNTVGMTEARTHAFGGGGIYVRNALETTIGGFSTEDRNYAELIRVENSESTTIVRNYIGLTTEGEEPEGSKRLIPAGIYVLNSTSNNVSYNDVGYRNGAGILFEDSDINEIRNNRAFSNRQAGIGVFRGPQTTLLFNYAFDNGAYGISVNRSGGAQILGNTIGLTPDRDLAPNKNHGILVNVSNNVTVESNTASAADGKYAVAVSQELQEEFSTRTLLRFNKLGVDVNGQNILGRGGIGLKNAMATTVEHSQFEFIRIVSSDSSRIYNNDIGVVFDDFAEEWHPTAGTRHPVLAGIDLENANFTEIGLNHIGFRSGMGIRIVDSEGSSVISNTIFENGGQGIGVVSGKGHALRGNRIFDNGMIPIDLGANGPTPNDPDDSDTGPNELLNAPVLLMAVPTASAGTYELTFHWMGDFNGEAAPFDLEVYENGSCHGYSAQAGRLATIETGKVFPVSPGANGSTVTTTVQLNPASPYFAATFLDESGNTSELGNCLRVDPNQVSTIATLPTGVSRDLLGMLLLINHFSGKNSAPAEDVEAYVVRSDQGYAGDIFSGTAATAPNDTPIVPRSTVGGLWHVFVPAVARPTMDVCLPTTGLSQEDVERSVVLARGAETGGAWLPFDTRLETIEGERRACASGIEFYGHLTLGSGEEARLAVPTLVSPANDAIDVSRPPTLSWEAVDGATAYHVQVARDVAFGYVLGEDSTLTERSWTGPEGLFGDFVHYWRVRGMTADGPGPWSTPFRFVTLPRGVAAETELPIPKTLAISSVYPNPFADRATIVVDLPEAGPVRLEAFDLLGRRVAVVHDGMLPAGSHEIELEASHLPAGSYLVRAVTSAKALARMITVVR